MQAGAEGRPVARQQAIQDIGVGDAIEANTSPNDAADREETQAKAEDVDEHDTGPEDRRADSDEGTNHRAVVERRSAMRCGDDAGRDANDERDHERGEAELDGGAKVLTELSGYRLVGPNGVAEIERESGLQKVGKLDRQGPVEAELLTNPSDLFSAPLVAGHGDRWVTGNELNHDEHRRHDAEKHWNGQEQAAGDVSRHRCRRRYPSPSALGEGFG